MEISPNLLPAACKQGEEIYEDDIPHNSWAIIDIFYWPLISINFSFGKISLFFFGF